jgi:hypothetical protein
MPIQDQGLKVVQNIADVRMRLKSGQGGVPVSGFFSLGNSTKISLATGFESKPIQGTGIKTFPKNITTLSRPKVAEITIENNTMPKMALAIATNCNLAKEIHVSGATITDEIQLGFNNQQFKLNQRGVSLDNNNVPVLTITTPVEGDGTGYLTNGAVNLGSLEIVVDGGTNDILDGETITIADYAESHVVKTGVTGGSGTIILKEGVKSAIPDGKAITIVAQKTLVYDTDFVTDKPLNHWIEIQDGVLGLGGTELSCTYDHEARYEVRLTRDRQEQIIVEMVVDVFDRNNNEFMEVPFGDLAINTDTVIELITLDDPQMSNLKCVPLFDTTTDADFELIISNLTGNIK